MDIEKCPHCGSPAEYQYKAYSPDGKRVHASRYRIICTRCLCSTPWLYYETDAVEVWNKRVPTIVAGDSDVHVKAKWLNTSNPNQLKCSNCGVIHFIGQYPSGEINWCPNCGADMRGNKNG